jgi:hypothetical protein
MQNGSKTKSLSMFIIFLPFGQSTGVVAKQTAAAGYAMHILKLFYYSIKPIEKYCF